MAIRAAPRKSRGRGMTKAARTESASKPVSPAPVPTSGRRRLQPAAIRLMIVVLLFLGWMSYLGYLVAIRPVTSDGVPLVLSRPQFLVSELDIIAEVDSTAPDAQVVVTTVLYPKSNAPVEEKQRLRVDNLAQCRRQPNMEEKAEDVKPDWTGPGLYLLALQKGPDDVYEVVPTPPSPGYPPPTRMPTPRMYPVSDPALRRAALAQYDAIKKPISK